MGNLLYVPALLDIYPRLLQVRTTQSPTPPTPPPLHSLHPLHLRLPAAATQARLAALFSGAPPALLPPLLYALLFPLNVYLLEVSGEHRT
jgi:hypothetical protein